jgi:uncharacterized protein DUF397
LRSNTVNFGSAVWHKSSFSDHNGSCVEVALTAMAVGIRDSKDIGVGPLVVAPDGWAALVAVLKRGR